MTSLSNPAEPASWFAMEVWHGAERMSKLNLQQEPKNLDDFCKEFAVAAWQGRSWDQHRDTPNIRKFFREYPSRSPYWPRLVDFEQFLRTSHQGQNTKQWNVYERVADDVVFAFPKDHQCPDGMVESIDVRTDEDREHDADAIQKIMKAPRLKRWEMFNKLIVPRYQGRSLR